MAANPHKWVRKRPAEDSESPEPESPEKVDGFENWKVKPFEEIMEEKRRKKMKGESYEKSSQDERYSSASPRPEESGRRSKHSSQQNSPRTAQDWSGNELVYELSPEHDSFLESPGKNNDSYKERKSSRDSTPHSVSGQQDRRTPLKSVEEEGEIVSDVSEEEEAEETSSEEKRPWRKEEKTEKKQVEEKMEISSTTAQEQTDSSSSGDSDSQSESGSDSESSSEEEEEEEEKEKENENTEKEKKPNGTETKSNSQEETSENTTEQNETKSTEVKVSKHKAEESESSGDSESGSGSDSDSSSSEESSSEEEEKEEDKKKEENPKELEQDEEMEDTEDLHKELARVSQKQNVKHKDVKKPKEKEHSRTTDQKAATEKQEASKHEHRHSRHKYHHEHPKKHRHTEETRHPRERQYEEPKQVEKTRGASVVSKDRTDKQDTQKYRTNEKGKSKERKGKETKHGKDKVEKRKEEEKSKRKTSKSPKARSKTTDEKTSRTEHKRRKSAEKKASKDSLKLTDTEKNKFNTEVVDVQQSDNDSSINEEDFQSISDEESRSEAEEAAPPAPVVEQLPPYEPAIQGCRSVDEFQCINRIEEGTYGVVYRAKDKRTGEIVALKRLKMEREKEGFPITSLREVSTLLKGQHPNIVTVREIVVGSNMDKIYIVMDYVEHDLKTLMEHMNQPFYVGEVKTLMIQLLRAVQHLHDNWILHRDLKASNLLLSNKGVLKVGDFGLAREYGSPLKNYTPIVVTLWYRSPELLLGVKEYSTPIDLWSVGCIFAELLTRKPLFPGKSEIDQINLVFKELGTPSDKIWPGPPAYSELPHVKKMTFTEYPYNSLRNRFDTLLTDKGFDLLNRFLTYDPKKRITADEALRHAYFDESPKPVDPSMFPSWPAKSEMAKLPKQRVSPKAPEGGAMFLKLVDEPESSQDIAKKLGTVTAPGFSLKF